MAILTQVRHGVAVLSNMVNGLDNLRLVREGIMMIPSHTISLNSTGIPCQILALFKLCHFPVSWRIFLLNSEVGAYYILQ